MSCHGCAEPSRITVFSVAACESNGPDDERWAYIISSGRYTRSYRGNRFIMVFSPLARSIILKTLSIRTINHIVFFFSPLGTYTFLSCTAGRLNFLTRPRTLNKRRPRSAGGGPGRGKEREKKTRYHTEPVSSPDSPPRALFIRATAAPRTV